MREEVILETDRLRLVTWSADDIHLAYDLHSTIETTRYLNGASPWSREKCRERLSRWINDHTHHGLAKYKLLSLDDNRFVGRAGFSYYKGERLDFELGYTLYQREWGKGYATEISSALRDWFFERKIAGQFIAFTHPDNQGSQNVLTKIGMRSCQPMTIEKMVCPTFEYTTEMYGNRCGR